MGAVPDLRMSEADYLAYDLARPGRHEFVNGEVIAMSGGSEAHALATTNLTALLHRALRGGPCRVYSNDLRVRIDETGLYAYPDLSIVCGRAELAPTNPLSLLNPRVLVEVLSDSTEAHDRGAKAAHYRRRPSVEALVFVATRTRNVEVHTRNADGSWTLRDATSGEIGVGPLGVTLPLDDVYADFDALADG